MFKAKMIQEENFIRTAPTARSSDEIVVDLETPENQLLLFGQKAASRKESLARSSLSQIRDYFSQSSSSSSYTNQLERSFNRGYSTPSHAT